MVQGLKINSKYAMFNTCCQGVKQSKRQSVDIECLTPEGGVVKFDGHGQK